MAKMSIFLGSVVASYIELKNLRTVVYHVFFLQLEKHNYEDFSPMLIGKIEHCAFYFNENKNTDAVDKSMQSL